MNEDRKQHLTEFVAWVRTHLTGDESKLVRYISTSSTMRKSAGDAVVAPGIPPDYLHLKKLVADDCIQPRSSSLT